MALGLYTFPPLGRVCPVRTQATILSVVLEVADHDAEKTWEICLWYSSGDQPWQEKIVPSTPRRHFPTFSRSDSLTHRHLCYSVELPTTSSLRFTFKFRSDQTLPWTWARDVLGVGDGLIIPNVEIDRPLTDDLSNIIHGLNPELKVTPVLSQTPRTQLWTIEAAIAPASDNSSAYADIELGTPWAGFVRFFALVRHSSPWLGPRHGKTGFSLDKDALLCSFLSQEGKHLVLLGIGSMDHVMTLLRSTSKGSVMLHIRSDHNVSSNGMLLAAVGDDCESAIAAVTYHARTMLSGTNSMIDQGPSVPRHDSGPAWMQNWYDGLGYCTWNALGQRLTEQKILDAVDVLKRNNININTLIIDDNWQDVDYQGPDSNSYGWKRFEAEPEAFPNGLRHTVSQIRSRFSNIEHVAVWHALLGYWGGISPHGDIASQYQTVEVHREGTKADGPMTVIAKADVRKYYNDFYRFLSSCGVDGVKTDAQFMLDHLVSPKHRRELTNEYLDAWKTASLRHFGDISISCMSQAPQILFHQQLPQNTPSIPVRNSDDYFPGVTESHPWHIWTNAHNALFTQHLNILPDWDMFQTSNEYAGYHAAARCISGGPIYITDVPGQHDIELINRVTSVSTRGKTIILRPSVVGKAIDPYTGYDEDALLKVGCYHGKAATGTPMLAVFNTRSHTLTEIIPLDCFPGVVSSGKYVVRSYQSGIVTEFMGRELQMARLGVRLPKAGYDIFTAYPVTHFDSETNGRIVVASLGLIGKMTGAAAILENHFEMLPTGRVISATRLKALGTLGLYISNLPHMSIERDFMITIQSQPVPFRVVTIDQQDSRVLAVDIQEAWNEMGLNSGWSNELEVKIYFDAEHP
ncbi:glycoside hydrolase family 36 protein [Xylaria sp. CBS 124048]|nr:glycoside hydrolase family 36 protein [Xylaria sp. CBS 124048]